MNLINIGKEEKNNTTYDFNEEVLLKGTTIYSTIAYYLLNQ